MSVNVDQREIVVEDAEYLRHGDQPLLARIYRPAQGGPYPVVVDVHGGAWCRKDRTTDVATAEPLARSGVVVVSLDFRMPPGAKYPASLCDINYAVRWSKAHAGRWKADAERVALLGVSSGGHQSLMTAMRPEDPRYASISTPEVRGFDAHVRCLILCWPVVDPLERYRHARRLEAEGNAFGARLVAAHHAYWEDEAEMEEANPKLALERGEPARTMPLLYLQGTADLAHPVHSREAFIAAWRARGASVELHLYEGMGEAFITTDPTAPHSVAAVARIVDFVRRELA